jgi:hypothetical protein
MKILHNAAFNIAISLIVAFSNYQAIVEEPESPDFVACKTKAVEVGKTFTVSSDVSSFYFATNRSGVFYKKKIDRKDVWLYSDLSSFQTKVVSQDDSELSVLSDNNTILTQSRDGKVNKLISLSSSKTVDITSLYDEILYVGDIPGAAFLLAKKADTKVIIRPDGTRSELLLPSTYLLNATPSVGKDNVPVFAAYSGSKGNRTFYDLLINPKTGECKFYPHQTFHVSKPNKPNDAGYLLLKRIGLVEVLKFDDSNQNPDSESRNTLNVCLSDRSSSVNSYETFLGYLDRGTLICRSITEIPLQKAKDIERQKAIESAMKDAKNMATATLIYAVDADDVLPPSDGYATIVKPYASDADKIRRFNYTRNGESLSSIENPALKELGFVVGPGGRAQAYCDGSVRWIPDL